MNLRDKCNKMLPERAGILHAVSSSNQPGWTDDGRSTDVSAIFNVEADLPGILSVLGSLATNNTRRFEHALSTVCKAKPGIRIVACCCSTSGVQEKTLRVCPTYHSWPHQIRPHSPPFHHIQGSASRRIYCLNTCTSNLCTLHQSLDRGKDIFQSVNQSAANSSHNVTFAYWIHSLTHPNRRHSRLFRRNDSSLKHTSCSDN